MSDQRIAELYELLVNGKRKPATVEYPFNRGWNAGIDFAIRQIPIVCDEVADEQQEPAQ